MSGWTKASNPPEIGRRVYVTDQYGTEIGTYVGSDSPTGWWDDCENDIDVMAWQELPEPYKGVKHE